ncbi:hypothetical protein AK973_5965 [Pseudomonas brassicacearum]|uniref:Uncharacterized protein n=1 Tax=Pseudomonas brassicacearum (strain NFM421) TaxID=994484 RepID=F2K6L4_PSEBN|nr:Hypothetical protein PSEBR_gl122 [Pseudomonas brassicacearum subsp. brassicacearum NFM421]ALQ06414.1 hypothetical protein AK973_5965 [Pseudomonas brassicacearum]
MIRTHIWHLNRTMAGHISKCCNFEMRSVFASAIAGKPCSHKSSSHIAHLWEQELVWEQGLPAMRP